jgi:hypothetical protein
MSKYKPPSQMRVLSVNLRVDISIAERCQQLARQVFPFDEKLQKWNHVAALLLDVELRRWEEARRLSRQASLRERMRSVAIEMLAPSKILSAKTLTKVFPGQRKMANIVLKALVKDGLLEEFSDGKYRRVPRQDRFVPDPLIVALGNAGADCGIDRALDAYDDLFGGPMLEADGDESGGGTGEGGPSDSEGEESVDDFGLDPEGRAGAGRHRRVDPPKGARDHAGRFVGTIRDFVREGSSLRGQDAARAEREAGEQEGDAEGMDPEAADL